VWEFVCFEWLGLGFVGWGGGVGGR
jgi:hypothetical protein